MKKVIILGGGLSGLAAGEILSKHFEVTILESAQFLGGLAANFQQGGKNIPLYYHHIIKSNTTTQKYLWEFGKIKKLFWKRIKVAIAVKGKCYTINSPFDLLKFKYLNLYEKMRFGLFGAYTLFLLNPNKIKEGLDAGAWLKKYAGEAVTKKVFDHLYSKNKFNIPLSQISAKQFANRLYEKEVYDLFAFPKESYQPMIEGLVKSIKDKKGKIKLNSKLREVNLKKKYIVDAGKKINYDLLVSSIPFPEFLRLTTGIPKDYANKLEKIKYCSAVSVCFATEELLNKDNYWINLFGERTHTLFQHSLLNDNYEYKVNWTLRYGGSEEDLNRSDEEIKREYLEVVKKYFPKAKILWIKVMRTKYAEPIYDINYHTYMPDYSTPLEGLYFTGIQLTHPRIRNMNVALESGIKAAELIIKENL